MGKRKPTKHSVGIWCGLLANSQTLRQTGGFCIKARQCLYPESWSWNVMNCGPRFRHFSQPWFFTLGKRNKNPLPAIFEQVFFRADPIGIHFFNFFGGLDHMTMLCLCYAMKPTKDAMFSAPSGIEFKDVDPQADQFFMGPRWRASPRDSILQVFNQREVRKRTIFLAIWIVRISPEL